MDTKTASTARATRLDWVLGGAATVAGAVAWLVFFQADLVLSHYDAKAHLVVARRVLDSITPNWQQVGAVWLPLPHLIQLLPVQIDLFYRTGLSASLVSILCFGVTAFAFARLTLSITGSRAGAVTAAALLALNPNVLYLQATPMTEPLLMALTALSVLWLFEWTGAESERLPHRVGLVLFGAMWTRYEAWPILAAAVAASVYALWRRGVTWPALRRRTLALVAWPAAAVLIFLVNSRITIRQWFVTGGFYVPDPTNQGQPLRTLAALLGGTESLSGYALVTAGLAGAIALVARSRRGRHAGRMLLPVALFAASALPFYAFFEGHPFRVRYMVPLVAACALSGGIVTGLTRRWAPLVAAVLVTVALVESPPWDREAPMLVEAQWDRPASRARRTVTACLAAGYRGEKVLASMGSLAHYMQELSWAGFEIADFIHEGNNAIWDVALETGPAPHAGWMLVDEQSEGGDVLARRIRADPRFTAGMSRACEGGGVALYRRNSRRD